MHAVSRPSSLRTNDDLFRSPEFVSEVLTKHRELRRIHVQRMNSANWATEWARTNHPRIFEDNTRNDDSLEEEMDRAKYVDDILRRVDSRLSTGDAIPREPEDGLEVYRWIKLRKFFKKQKNNAAAETKSMK